MNHVFRLIWSRVNNTWSIASENTKDPGKTGSGRKRIAAVAFLASLPLLAQVPAAQAADGITDLGLLNGGGNSQAYGVNAAGDVVVGVADEPAESTTPSAGRRPAACKTWGC